MDANGGTSHRPAGPALLLLDGVPGVGTSTLARLVAERLPGAVALDVDLPRSRFAAVADGAGSWFVHAVLEASSATVARRVGGRRRTAPPRRWHG